MSDNQDNKKAFIFASITVLLWSTVATAFKLTLTELTPAQMVLVASFVSCLVLLIICIFQKKQNIILQTFYQKPGFYLISALINPLAYYITLFKAYDLLPASQAQSINYSWAITLTIMSAIFLKQKIYQKDWIACFLGYLGIIIIATKGNLESLEPKNLLGIFFALTSTILWASYWIINTKNKSDPLVSLLISFTLSLPFSFFLNIYLGSNWHNISLSTWLSVTYIGCFEMGISFALWLSALKHSSNTSRISNLIFLSPILSLILLSQMIGEKIHPSVIIGLGLIITGLIIQQIKWKSNPSAH